MKNKKIFISAFLSVLLFITVVSLFIWNQQEGGSITVSYTEADGIPVIETYRDNGKTKPMIILQHGFKNKKDSVQELAEQLAEEGFFVIAPDAYGHGERTEPALSLVEIIVNTSGDYNDIIKSYENDRRTDIRRLGIAGFSMGGCIAFHYAVYGDYSTQAIAPTISTPYFEQLAGTDLGHSYYSSRDGLYVEKDPIKAQEIDKLIEKYSPFKDYENLYGVKIFMQNGALDTYVNSSGAERLCDALSDTGDVELLMEPGLKHQVNQHMRDRIVEFMTLNIQD